jgi:hypothetical protein
MRASFDARELDQALAELGPLRRQMRERRPSLADAEIEARLRAIVGMQFEVVADCVICRRVVRRRDPRQLIKASELDDLLVHHACARTAALECLHCGTRFLGDDDCCSLTCWDERRRDRSTFYRSYIRSPEWRVKCEQVRDRAGGRCEGCGGSGPHFMCQTHHLSYRNLGDEPLSDLAYLCIDCHKKADEARRAKTQDRQRYRWAERVRGYAAARYGDAWQFERDYYEVEAELREWLEEIR